MKIGLKLTLSFFIIAFVSILIIGVLSYRKGKGSLQQEAFNRLTAVREMKATQIEDYFQSISDQIVTFTETPNTIRSLTNFIKGFDKIEKDLAIDDSAMSVMNWKVGNYFNTQFLDKLNKNLKNKATLEQVSSTDKRTRILQNLFIASNPHPVGSKQLMDSTGDTSAYNKVHKVFHPRMWQFLQRFGFYDIFLVDGETGNIVYTVFKEVDFGTSLLTGPFKETNLAEAFRAANAPDVKKGFVKLVDFKNYYPSYNAPAAFIACPIFDKNKKIGVAIFQMPIDRINSIMTSKEQWSKVGLGTSGETYIVGGDFTLRNQSRFLIEDKDNYFKMIANIGTPIETLDKIKNFNSAIGLQEVRTDGTIDALKGNTDAKIFPDYRGVPVLSAYKPLNIPGMHWVIMSEIDEEEAFASVYQLRWNIIYVFIGLVILITIVSLAISKRITKPLNILTEDAVELAKGNFDVEISIRRKDEIGILSQSFRKMQMSIKRLIEELKEINHNLEAKVIDRTKEIHLQKELVEEKNKEIVDSINYALRLQQAILPPIEKVKESLEQSFVLFKPKDIVSGDFYWMDSRSHKLLIAAVDCTGHGVPGAMVSVVGANGLNRCVKEFGLSKPSSILEKLNELIEETFETTDQDVKDGMDMALVAIDLKTHKVEYCGANNPLWILRKGSAQIEEITANKQPIGKFDFRKPFTNHALDLNKGDLIYIFTDGYADQFGGSKGKKFKYKTLQNLLESMADKPMDEQHATLDKSFEDWRGELDQVDDVCVIGIRL